VTNKLDEIRDVIGETTILIAGPAHRVSLQNLDVYKQFCREIVISAWSDYPPHAQDILAGYPRDPSTKLVLNRSPVYQGNTRMFKHYATLYPQVVGIREGLKECTSKYLIRTRSDAFFTDLLPLIRLFSRPKNIDRVVCGNVIYRTGTQNSQNGFGKTRDHIGDHLFMCKTKMAKKVYDKFYNHSQEPSGKLHGICEVALARFFREEIFGPLPGAEESSRLRLNSWQFPAVNIEELGKFRLSAAGRKYFSEKGGLSNLRAAVRDLHPGTRDS